MFEENCRTLSAYSRSNGTAIAVDDSELLDDLRGFGAREGLLKYPNTFGTSGPASDQPGTY